MDNENVENDSSILTGCDRDMSGQDCASANLQAVQGITNITGCNIDIGNKVNKHTVAAVQALANAATANANAIAAIAAALTPGTAPYYGIYVGRD